VVFHSATPKVQSLSLTPPTTLCRVKRHWMTSSNRKHGRPAELKPESTICTQGLKVSYKLLDPKLCSKVLTKQTGQHSVTSQYAHVLMAQRHPEVRQLCKRGLLTPTLAQTRLFTGFSNQVDVQMLAHHRGYGERLACSQ
jgi:hypothetical protein